MRPGDTAHPSGGRCPGDPNLVIIAGTDIRVVDGLNATIERAKRLADAGADAIFRKRWSRSMNLRQFANPPTCRYWPT